MKKPGRYDKDRYYCSICGGIPAGPDHDQAYGGETGINHLSWIFEEVKNLTLVDDTASTEELLKRVKEFNYVPTKKADVYANGLLEEQIKKGNPE